LEARLVLEGANGMIPPNPPSKKGGSDLLFGDGEGSAIGFGNSHEVMIPPNPPSKKGGSDLLFGDGEGSAIAVWEFSRSDDPP